MAETGFWSRKYYSVLGVEVISLQDINLYMSQNYCVQMMLPSLEKEKVSMAFHKKAKS